MNLRFAILRHTGWSGDHYDLMLERSGKLATWRIESLQSAEAVQSFDHRLEYLTFEGEVSGGRGRVDRVDEGTFEILTSSSGEIRAALTGREGRREVKLTLKSEEAGEGAVWSLAFTSAGPGDPRAARGPRKQPPRDPRFR